MNPNPFLTSEAQQASTDAGVLYIRTLDQHLCEGQPIDWLERMQQTSRTTLDATWQVALTSATAGNVQGGVALLASFLMEWATYKALEHLIGVEQHGIVLDLFDSVTYAETQRSFQMAMDNQVIYLTTQLHNALLAGHTQREQERQNTLTHGYTELHDIAMQVIQQRDTSLQSAHQQNEQYADIALKGIAQGQQGVYWMQEGVVHMYEFVKGTQENMVGGMQALQGHLEQNLPSAINEARRQRVTHMIVWVLVICGIGVGLFVLACLIGTHL